MPSISSCPECHRDLTIPDLDAPDHRLRCPLCEAQFPAERILADSVAFPPLALVVDEATDGVWPPEPPTAAASDLSPPGPEAQDPAPAPADLAELPPAHGEPLSPAGPFWPASESPEEPATAPPAVADDSIAPTEEEKAIEDAEIDVAIEADETSVLAPDEKVLSRGEGLRDESGVDAFGGVAISTGPEPASTDVERPSFHVAAQRRRRVSATGAIVQLLGMAAGGALGLAIGYWILLWINPRADFLELRGKLPAWMMPGGRHSSLDRAPVENPGEVVAISHHSLDDPTDETDAPARQESQSSDAVQPVDFIQTDTADLADSPQFAEPPPEEPPPPMFGPRGFMPHDSEELKSALDSATRALRCEYCQAKRTPSRTADGAASSDASAGDLPPRKTPRCEHCRGTGIGNITAPVFERLCQLAETATFAQLDDADDAARDEYRHAAQDLMLLVGGDRARGEVIGRLAADRLDDSQRPSNGVILCGSVAGTRNQGELFATRIVLSGIARTVTVVSRDAPQPPFGPRDHVLILGSIIDSPANNLAGYEGNEPQVIWGGVPFKLSGPAY
ncbi:MAG TPA: hypothetical protein VFW87_03130 [Pirellulales bacterium]|nr:hypothetical protein [Pirellulales bacterium]